MRGFGGTQRCHLLPSAEPIASKVYRASRNSPAYAIAHQSSKHPPWRREHSLSDNTAGNMSYRRSGMYTVVPLRTTWHGQISVWCACVSGYMHAVPYTISVCCACLCVWCDAPCTVSFRGEPHVSSIIE